MPFDKSQESFLELRDLVERPGARVVPFVGAGLSVFGRPGERLPLWREYAASLRSAVRDLGLESVQNAAQLQAIDSSLHSGDYIVAVDLIVSILGDEQFRRLTERLLDVDGRAVPPALLELLYISWSLIVTTNLDRFIERGLSEHRRPPAEVLTSTDIAGLQKSVMNARLRKGCVVAKIHGTLEKFDTWVFTRSQYERLLANAAYLDTLKSLFLQIVFFVGYGLEDADMNLVLTHIRAIYPAGARGSSYALLPDYLRGRPQLRRLIVDDGLTPIWYDYKDEARDAPDGGHGEVLECLELLARCWLRQHADLQVTLRYFPELDPLFVGREKELGQLWTIVGEKRGRGVEIVGFGGEGKTSLAQAFALLRRADLARAGFEAVIGFSFYRADVGAFVHDLWALLRPPGPALTIAEKGAAVVAALQCRRILLIVDGVEEYVGESGSLSNPLLARIVASGLSGPGAVIVTSRVASRLPVQRISLRGLCEADVETLATRLGTSARVRQVVTARAASHALSLRLLFSRAREREPEDGVELGSLETLRDEADPRRANRVWRMLESYWGRLPLKEKALLSCLAAFRGPAAVDVILAVAPLFLGAAEVNASLAGHDIRPVILSLVRRRLIILNENGEIGWHPLVKEFVVAKTEGRSFKRFHSALLDELSRGEQAALPETFEEVYAHFELCYQAAKAERWSEYHRIFFDRINHGELDYLVDFLGGWQEYLHLAQLAFPEDDVRARPRVSEAHDYYRAGIARATKHLGRGQEALVLYWHALVAAAETRSKNTAMYANNCFTLALLMAKFDLATHLMRLNLGALHWIDEDWRRLWQLEHAFFPFSRFAALVGDLETAEVYSAFADRVWSDAAVQQRWIFDFDRQFRAELLLAIDASRVHDALVAAEDDLRRAHRFGWREAAARALRTLATVCRIGGEADPSLRERSKKHLGSAADWCERLSLPGLRIEVQLERTASYLAEPCGSERMHPHDWIGECEGLIETTGLEVYRTDMLALRGQVALLDGSTPDAARDYSAAVEHCRRCGHVYPFVAQTSELRRLARSLDLERDLIIPPVDLPTFSSPMILLETSITPRDAVELLHDVRPLMSES